MVNVAFLPGGESGLLPFKTNPNRPWQKILHAALVFSLIRHPANIFFSGIRALALRLAALSELGGRGPAGVVSRRIFVSRMVELLPRCIRHQDADRNPVAGCRFPDFLSLR